MKGFTGMAAIGAALALASVATGAHAGSGPKTTDFTTVAAATAFSDTGSSNTVRPATPHKSLQWDGKGRWGLKLDYQQPSSQNTQWQSIDVGTFYKVTPRLHIGGAVGLTDQPDPRYVAPDQQAPQPRVRLETTFKF